MTGALRTTMATRWFLAERVNDVCVIVTLITAFQTVVTQRLVNVSSVSITQRGIDVNAVNPATMEMPPLSPAEVL